MMGEGMQKSGFACILVSNQHKVVHLLQVKEGEGGEEKRERGRGRGRESVCVCGGKDRNKTEIKCQKERGDRR